MICANCQKEIADGSNFCYNCGARQPAGSNVNTPAYTGARKRLMRSSTDKKIAGVCAGLADYFELDVTIIRVVWILAVLCVGTGILVYVILWIALPLAPTGMTSTSAPATY